jgi:hypothetical protein
LKKSLAIVFVILILFNVMGYYVIFLGLQYTNDTRVMRQLDEEKYDESETFTVKIPLAIPYATDSRGFERIDGKFEHNGQFYRMIKQRLSRDTIYVVCLVDSGTKRIDSALGSYVKTFTDQAGDSQSGLKTFPTFFKDYFTRTISVKSISAGWEMDVLNCTSLAFFISSFYPSIIHPPENLNSQILVSID